MNNNSKPARYVDRPSPAEILEEVWTPSTQIPTALRDWGFFPQISAWHPGDLILTRNTEPDIVSKAIGSFQLAGYGPEASTWTHAAVYLGDGLMLCEAQFDPPKIASVIVAPLFNYIGTHELMVKRSSHADSKELGWAIAVAAATKLGSKYDVGFIAELASKRAWLGDIWSKDLDVEVSRTTFVCSSLYSTAHAYATGVSITDRTNGLCVPAFLALSGTPHLRKVDFGWHRIA